MAFIRFVIRALDSDSGVEAGIFSAAYALRDGSDVSLVDREALAEELAWFEKHLTTPTRFNRTSSKGHYRRSTKGVSWFKDDAREYLTRMHHLKSLLEANGHDVTMIVEDRIGYVVYEDECQVVAEPFSETRTGRVR